MARSTKSAFVKMQHAKDQIRSTLEELQTIRPWIYTPLNEVEDTGLRKICVMCGFRSMHEWWLTALDRLKVIEKNYKKFCRQWEKEQQQQTSNTTNND